MTDRPAGADDAALGRGEPDSGWVLLAEAAAQAGCTEAWLVDRCNDGRLPSRHRAGADVIVPLATVRALVRGEISD